MQVGYLSFPTKSADSSFTRAAYLAPNALRLVGGHRDEHFRRDLVDSAQPKERGRVSLGDAQVETIHRIQLARSLAQTARRCGSILDGPDPSLDWVGIAV